MTATLLYLNWLNLRRDYLAVSLIFLLPILFFSLYALIFGSMGGSESSASKVKVTVLDLDHSVSSRNLQQLLAGHPAITSPIESPTIPLDPTSLIKRVSQGNFAAIIVVPQGFAESLEQNSASMTPIQLYYDNGNPITRYMLADIIQSAAMAVKIGLTNASFATCRNPIQSIKNPLDLQVKQALCPGQLEYLPIERIRANDKLIDPIAYYAAAVSMMFLLFAMSGAGGFLLEQQETGTLERLLNCNVGMGRLLLGSWLFFASVGLIQVLVTFLWGALVFGVDLWRLDHLIGTLIISIFAALNASAFGIVLAVLCKTRAQLNGISTLVILMMSALGGSMVPQFIMPTFMQKLSLFTMNGWVLDGYTQVFAEDNPVTSVFALLPHLASHCLILSAGTLCCLVTAYVLSRRWETI